MINDKIAAAKQAKRQHLLKTLLLLLIITLLAVALIIWASLPKSAEESVDNSSSDAETATDVLEIDAAMLRQAYIDAFADFENQIKPRLDKIDLPQWNPAVAEQLDLLEARALNAFSAGEYGKAYTSIKSLTERAENTIAESEKQFDTAMQNAKNAFDNNDYARARAAIDKAQILDNTSEAAKNFSERVETLPEIAELVSQIKTANAENNPRRERDLIQQLLKLTPERETLKQRARELTSKLNSSEFQKQIAQGQQALETADLSAAQSALAKARQIYPDQPAVHELDEAIETAREDRQIRQLEADATAAEAADNWREAKSHLEKIQSLKPNDKALSERLAVANDIVALQSQIDDTLKSPYRLSEKAAETTARQLVESAQDYQAQSPSLADKSRELNDVLTAINQPVDVTIRSDNQTHISVRGVGHVGTTESKTIQLTPGKYTFEGKRPGYKSKLKTVEVPLDQNSLTFTLICDEPI